MIKNDILCWIYDELFKLSDETISLKKWYNIINRWWYGLNLYENNLIIWWNSLNKWKNIISLWYNDFEYSIICWICDKLSKTSEEML